MRLGERMYTSARVLRGVCLGAAAFGAALSLGAYAWLAAGFDQRVSVILICAPLLVVISAYRAVRLWPHLRDPSSIAEIPVLPKGGRRVYDQIQITPHQGRSYKLSVFGSGDRVRAELGELRTVSVLHARVVRS